MDDGTEALPTPPLVDELEDVNDARLVLAVENAHAAMNAKKEGKLTELPET